MIDGENVKLTLLILKLQNFTVSSVLAFNLK